MYENSDKRRSAEPGNSSGGNDGDALRVIHLSTCFDTPPGSVKVVDGVSFSLQRGKVLGIIGESGCGKTATILSIMRLLPANGSTAGGRVIYRGRDLLRMRDTEMRCIRGGGISMIFQEPSSSFNPYLKISTQMLETIRLHRHVDRHEARRTALELLDFVGIPDPAKRIENYPHQFSGGMLQRVLVAVAVGCGAEVILADEPTSDLDVTSQDRTLDLMRRVVDRNGTAILLVTHDFGVAARMCDTIGVMYAGRLVETAPAPEFYRNPKHPYAQALVSVAPDARRRTSGVPAPIPGKPPDFSNLPCGCAFHPRCVFATDVCRTLEPPELGFGNRTIRCWLYGEG